jgi:hypothetical protein
MSNVTKKIVGISKNHQILMNIGLVSSKFNKFLQNFYNFELIKIYPNKKFEKLLFRFTEGIRLSSPLYLNYNKFLKSILVEIYPSLLKLKLTKYDLKYSQIIFTKIADNCVLITKLLVNRCIIDKKFFNHYKKSLHYKLYVQKYLTKKYVGRFLNLNLKNETIRKNFIQNFFLNHKYYSLKNKDYFENNQNFNQNFIKYLKSFFK